MACLCYSPAPESSRTEQEVEVLRAEEGPRLFKKGTFSPGRAVEKEPEGKRPKGNLTLSLPLIFVASGPAGKLTMHEWPFCLVFISKD